MKKKIGVVFGGKSDEYEISLLSAGNVLRALDSDKYEIVKIGINRDGKWYITDASIDEIEEGKWTNSLSNKEYILSADPSKKEFECIIPVLHGDHGEDGEIQGLFQMAEIPYVGSGVKASANCMDKSAAKQIAKLTGVRMAEHYLVRISNFVKDADAEVRKAMETLHTFPMFVKPSSAGSSVGVSKANTEVELKKGIAEALKYDHKVLVEECIKGRELEVAVLGNLEPEASSIGEIHSAAEFYDYESKYVNPEIQTSVVDDLPEEIMNEIRDYAKKLYKTLDCRGLARVDFFYADETKDGKRIVFNEINTFPGFTNISMYPMLWRHDGIETPALMDKLIELALDEHRDWVK